MLNCTWLQVQKGHKQRGTSSVYIARRNRLTLYERFFVDCQILQTFEPKGTNDSFQRIWEPDEAFCCKHSVFEKYQLTVQTSWLLASVKLQQPTILKKKMAPSSIIVYHTVHWWLGLFGSIDTEHYFWFQKKKIMTPVIVSVQSPWRVVCAHVQLNVMNKLYPVTLIVLWQQHAWITGKVGFRLSVEKIPLLVIL